MNHGFQRHAREVFSFVKTVCLLLALAFLVIRPTIIEPFQIPSSSMVPTLQIGDRILVNKLSYGLRLAFVSKALFEWDTPQRGDIVVFMRPDDKGTPEDESKVNYIKRIIGLAGDSVEVRGSSLFVNGNLIVEPYARYSKGGLIQGNFGPDTVPAGHVFLLGDNRDDSRDSRFWEQHYLDERRIKGRAFMIYWSWDSFSRIGTMLR